MNKFLIFLLMLAGAMLLVRLLNKPRHRKGSSPAKAPPATQRMVACALCGLYVPDVEAIKAGQAVYCCEDHRRRAG